MGITSVTAMMHEDVIMRMMSCHDENDKGGVENDDKDGIGNDAAPD